LAWISHIQPASVVAGSPSDARTILLPFLPGQPHAEPLDPWVNPREPCHPMTDNSPTPDPDGLSPFAVGGCHKPRLARLAAIPGHYQYPTPSGPEQGLKNPIPDVHEQPPPVVHDRSQIDVLDDVPNAQVQLMYRDFPSPLHASPNQVGPTPWADPHGLLNPPRWLHPP